MRPIHLACLACLLAAARSAHAGGGVSVLDLPPGAGATGAALVGVADDSDPSHAHFNPANAAAVLGLAYTSTYANWSGDVDYFANAIAVARAAGPLRVGGSVTHTRLDFKVFEESNDFVPFNNQASLMGAAAAVAWSASAGTLGVGAAIRWDTSDGGAPTLYDVGLRAEAPALRRGRAVVEAAAAWSSVGLGADAAGADTVASEFTTRPAEERHRFGASIRAILPRRSDDRAELLAITVNLDAIVADGGTATAAGAAVRVVGIVHLRAGYGDSIVAGKDAFTLGAGLGHRAGAFVYRVDYARVETTDDALAANAVGTSLSLEF